MTWQESHWPYRTFEQMPLEESDRIIAEGVVELVKRLGGQPSEQVAGRLVKLVEDARDPGVE